MDRSNVKTFEMPDDAGLRATFEEGILTVVLDRPSVGNAIHAPMMAALGDLWQWAARRDGLRCIVITGEGRFFCTGADASMLASDRRGGDDAMEELRFLPGPLVSVPVIVAVNGTCAGGGLHFVADADIVIAGDRAKFLDPHVSVGQVSALEPLQLRLRMRADRLMRMVLLGSHEVLDAAAAESAGLVSEVVPHDLLPARAREIAAAIGRNSPEAVRLSRRVLRQFESDLIGTHMDLGWELIQRHWAHPDAMEGPIAFQEKRAPRWVGAGIPDSFVESL